MMSILDSGEYIRLHSAVFREGYPGYKPNVVESPDGDGKWDAEKHYAHVAAKYLENYDGLDSKYLSSILSKLTNEARFIALALDVPRAFWPTRKYSALRILEYPPRATAAPHTDFDLFTLMCYRNSPENFVYCDVDLSGNSDRYLTEANKLNEQIHFGEILEIICTKYKATRHQVVADPQDRTQYSAVFFGIPDHAQMLPTGITVGEWIDERISRSRKTVA